MFLTIFTPTYNRANTLPRLYQSLMRQTVKDFCWLIVDDGSNDGTKELVDQYISENKLSIIYYKQENRGKSMAHNKGVEITTSELFTCVDSDDLLIDNAVEKIHYTWKRATSSDVGILAFKRTESRVVTELQDTTTERCTLKGAYDHLGLKGDTMLVYRTDIIRNYSFPDFENEKFVPEAYLYDQIDQIGTLMLLREPLYVCEYLSSGYTANMAKLLFNNPEGYFCYINQRLRFDSSLKQRFAGSIRYDAMAIAHKRKGMIRSAVYPGLALIAYPAGWLLYKRRYATYTEQ